MKEKITKSKFDQPEFNVTLDTDLFGQSLRERAIEISTMADQISRLYNHCLYKQNLLKTQIKQIRYLAYQKLIVDETFKKANIDIKTMMMDSEQIEIDGELTSILEKENQMAMYEFLASRGKIKLQELNNNLDLARTFLSWDKQAMEKGV